MPSIVLTKPQGPLAVQITVASTCKAELMSTLGDYFFMLLLQASCHILKSDNLLTIWLARRLKMKLTWVLPFAKQIIGLLNSLRTRSTFLVFLVQASTSLQLIPKKEQMVKMMSKTYPASKISAFCGIWHSKLGNSLKFATPRNSNEGCACDNERSSAVCLSTLHFLDRYAVRPYKQWWSENECLCLTFVLYNFKLIFFLLAIRSMSWIPQNRHWLLFWGCLWSFLGNRRIIAPMFAVKSTYELLDDCWKLHRHGEVYCSRASIPWIHLHSLLSIHVYQCLVSLQFVTWRRREALENNALVTDSQSRLESFRHVVNAVSPWCSHPCQPLCGRL